MSQIAVRRFATGGTNSSTPTLSVTRAFIGIAPRTKGGAIAGRLVEKMLDNMSGARDVVISVALYLRKYNVVPHYRGLKKGPAVIAWLEPAIPLRSPRRWHMIGAVGTSPAK